MPDQLSLLETRHFRGVAVRHPAARGFRLRGTTDVLVAGLEALDWDVTREPVENGPPGTVYLGIIQIAGSPWLDIFEPSGLDFLSDEVAESLSQACDTAVLFFDYQYHNGQLRHRLYEQGTASENLDVADSETSRGDLEACYRRWRMRDMGITLEDLASRSLPFPPTAIVEAWFLRLDRPSNEQAPAAP